MNNLHADGDRMAARPTRESTQCLSRGARLWGAVGLLASLLVVALLLVQPKLIAQEAPPAAPAISKAAPPAGNAENGKLLYVKIGCYECHDRDAEGAGTGPRLAPNPLPYGAFSHQVRQPANSMPPYTGKVLSDSDLADIYAFLQTIPKPPAVASIPLLQ
jgi:mono/diheme cytochrome c family protein